MSHSLQVACIERHCAAIADKFSRLGGTPFTRVPFHGWPRSHARTGSGPSSG